MSGASGRKLHKLCCEWRLFGSLVQHILNTLTLLFLNIEYEAHTELECMSDAKLRYTGHNSFVFYFIQEGATIAHKMILSQFFLARKTTCVSKTNVLETNFISLVTFDNIMPLLLVIILLLTNRALIGYNDPVVNNVIRLVWGQIICDWL